MENLHTAGLSLRTLKPVDYAQLVEDIQYNFLQILSSPGFKGMPGQSIAGPPGVGIRGSKWIFVSVSNFPEALSPNDISLVFINDYFVANPQEFTERLLIPDNSTLIYGDILVLPSGQIVQLVTGDDIDSFVDTGISFSQVSTLSAEQVVTIVQNLLGPLQEGSGFKYFNAVAKNASDDSPSQNTQVTIDGAIDIVLTGSGPGAELHNHKFYGPAEAQISSDMFVMQIIGSVQKYHDLIQQTQAEKTNAYLPGVDDWASMALLQNSYSNGLIFGHKNSGTIYDFGRLYKTASSTILTSNYSPLQDEYSELRLSATQALIRAKNEIEFRSSITRIVSAQLISNAFNYVDNVLTLGTNNFIVVFDAKFGVFFNRIKNADVLSTDANGKVVKTFTVGSNMTTPSNTQLVTTLMLSTLLTDINATLGLHQQILDDLLAVDNTVNFRRLNYVEQHSDEVLKNLNNHVIMGYVVLNLDLFDIATSPIFVTTKPTAPYSTAGTLKIYRSVANQDFTTVSLEQELVVSIIIDGALSHKKFRRLGSIDGISMINVTWLSWLEEPISLAGDSYISIANNKITHQPQTAINHDANDSHNVIRSIKTNAAGHVIEVQKTNALERLTEIEEQIEILKNSNFAKCLRKSSFDLTNPNTDEIYTINFPSVFTANYTVVGSLVSTSATDWTQDNDVIWTVRQKASTSFKLLLREVNPAAQNLRFEYMLLDL